MMRRRPHLARPHLARTRHVGRAVGLAGLLTPVLALGGCGSGADVATSPTSSSSSPPAPSPSASPSVSSTAPGARPSPPAGVPTGLPSAPATQAKTQESADQVATYVALLDYRAVYTRDVTPLLALVAPGDRCPECEHARRAVQRADPLFAAPAGGPRIRTVVPMSHHGDDYVVGVAYATPAAKVLNASGEVVGELQAYPDNYTEVHLAWDATAGTWRLRDYHAQKGGGDV